MRGPQSTRFFCCYPWGIHLSSWMYTHALGWGPITTISGLCESKNHSLCAERHLWDCDWGNLSSRLLPSNLGVYRLKSPLTSSVTSMVFWSGIPSTYIKPNTLHRIFALDASTKCILLVQPLDIQFICSMKKCHVWQQNNMHFAVPAVFLTSWLNNWSILRGKQSKTGVSFSGIFLKNETINLTNLYWHQRLDDVTCPQQRTKKIFCNQLYEFSTLIQY